MSHYRKLNTNYPEYNFEDDHPTYEPPRSFENALCMTPITTTKRLIFSWSQTSKSFLTTSYRPELTNDLLSYDEVQDAFSSLKNSPFYYKTGNVTNFIYLMAGITIVMLFFLFLFVFYFGKYVAMPGVFIFLYLVVYILIMYVTLIHMNKAKYTLIDRQRDFNRVFDYMNKASYLPKGCFFRSGRYGAWVELVIMENLVVEDEEMAIGYEDRRDREMSTAAGSPPISDKKGERVLDCYREIGDYDDRDVDTREQKPRSPFQRNQEPTYKLEKVGVKNSRENEEEFFSFGRKPDAKDPRETPFQDYPRGYKEPMVPIKEDNDDNEYR